MHKFTTRVELIGKPAATTYKKLHEAMAEKGFTRFFPDTHATYVTPEGEYLSRHNLKTNQVLELAREAAGTVWKDFRIFTTITQERWEYFNLKQLD